MKRLFVTGLLINLCVLQLHAWDILQPISGRSSSLGRCSVALCDFWSCHNNPAGLADLKYIGIGLSYENRFLIRELGYKNLGLTLPSQSGTFGLSLSQFGYEHYNENVIGLGFARNFGPHLKIGLKLDYIFLYFSEDYGRKSIPTFEIGMQYKINESLLIGTYLFNPIHVKIRSPNSNKIPIIARLGISYHINDEFMITSEIEEHSESDFSYRLGVEYEIYENTYVRSGFQLKPNLFSFGFGYKYRHLTIDISGQMYQELSASLNCSFIFKINRRHRLAED